jgi:hypothetical protein
VQERYPRVEGDVRASDASEGILKSAAEGSTSRLSKELVDVRR